MSPVMVMKYSYVGLWTYIRGYGSGPKLGAGGLGELDYQLGVTGYGFVSAH